MSSSLQIVIVGAGGFAREVFYWAAAAFPEPEYRLKGFLATDNPDLKRLGISARVLGQEDDYQIEENDRFILAIGDIGIRVRVASRLTAAGARFLTLTHPTAHVVPSATLGEGVIVCPYALVGPNASIGDFAVLNFYASCGHDARIGSHSVLSPYAVLTGGSEIAEQVFMGTHATIAPARKVGAQSKVSANSVVMRDVPAGSFVFGVPGRSQVIFDPGGGS